MLNAILPPHSWEPEISALEEFLDTLPLQYRTIVALAYFTSSRIEDILSLKFRDILAETIVIEESEPKQTKYVPIISILRPYLTVYLHGYKSHQSELLFTNSNGKPLKSSSVFKILNIVAKEINLPEIYLFVLK
ncbi:MAG: tyrosine-type recombinase/integrase [Crocosphaera sp.]|nr:tyrosine-type recombinase/integrase [Crocosphaera sp.]